MPKKKEETQKEEETPQEKTETTNKTETLQQELNRAKEELEDINNHNLRLQADFENFKKQTAKKEANIYKYANEQLIIKLLDIYEDMQRAIEQSTTLEEYTNGLELIYAKFDNILKGEGLEEIPTKGQKFDTFKHEAMMVDNSEDHENGDIIDELMKGYTLKDKVIKYSKVRVCKK